MKINLEKILYRLSLLVVAIALVVLYRTAIAQSTDFQVYWLVARALIEGRSIYDLEAFGGMVIKYPPWVSVLFYPFGWFDFVTAKSIWAFINILSLVWIGRILMNRLHVQWKYIFLIGLSYWGVWAVHFMDGQVSIPVLAVLLSVFVAQKESRLDFLAASLASIKVFTAFPLLVEWRRFLILKTTIGVLLWIGLGTVMVSTLTHQSVIDMMKEWIVAAASGASHLPEGHTRGNYNQGLPNFFANLLNLDPKNWLGEVSISMVLYVLGLLLIIKTIPKEDRTLRILAAIAWTPAAHPLPWFHVFTWSFPLMVYTFQKNKTNSQRLVSLVALFLVTMATEKLFGSMGKFLQDHSAKGWGVLLLIWANRTPSRKGSITF